MMHKNSFQNKQIYLYNEQKGQNRLKCKFNTYLLFPFCMLLIQNLS